MVTVCWRTARRNKRIERSRFAYPRIKRMRLGRVSSHSWRRRMGPFWCVSAFCQSCWSRTFIWWYCLRCPLKRGGNTDLPLIPMRNWHGHMQPGIGKALLQYMDAAHKAPTENRGFNGKCSGPAAVPINGIFHLRTCSEKMPGNESSEWRSVVWKNNKRTLRSVLLL